MTFAEDVVLDWVWNNRRVIFGGVLADTKVTQRGDFVCFILKEVAKAVLWGAHDHNACKGVSEGA